MKLLTIPALALALVLPANAQALATKKVLTLEGAKAVMAAAESYARAQNAPGAAIAVVDAGGNLLCLERLDGTFAAGAHVSIGKARTAALFQKPTSFFETLVNASGKGRTSMTALDDGFTPLQGGVPIVLDGVLAGAIGVSGAASAQQDEDVALAGAKAAEAFGTPAKSAAVSYFRKEAVAAAFQKGAPLLETADFKVHASHRDQPGQAEVHERDTDILYVLDGTATLVTGGQVVDPRPTAAGEIRGSSIDGGETRQLVAGDVLVVPAGTPHWFRTVSGPLDYYVVKTTR